MLIHVNLQDSMSSLLQRISPTRYQSSTEIINANKKFKIKWSIVDRAYPRAPGAKSCDLCAAERMHIAMGRRGFKRLPEGCVLLNKRQEIMAKCRHKRRHTLARVEDQ